MTGGITGPGILPPGVGASPVAHPAPPARDAAPARTSFQDVLAAQRDQDAVAFSKHAMQRVQRRGIEVDASTLQRLQDGVERAASKGSRDAVVLVSGTAFVVSITNRTVLTAVGPEHMRDQVFTNIDSAVIA